MAIPSSGEIGLDDIRLEFGGTAPHGLSEYYGVSAGVPSSGLLSISDFYGASASTRYEMTPTDTFQTFESGLTGWGTVAAGRVQESVGSTYESKYPVTFEFDNPGANTIPVGTTGIEFGFMGFLDQVYAGSTTNPFVTEIGVEYQTTDFQTYDRFTILTNSTFGSTPNINVERLEPLSTYGANEANFITAWNNTGRVVRVILWINLPDVGGAGIFELNNVKLVATY